MDYQQQFLNIINRERNKLGLPSLTMSSTLNNAAQWLSEDMASKNYLSHTDSLSRNPFQRLTAFGYTQGTRGENIAAGLQDPEATYQDWYNTCDPDQSGACTYAHRNNMLNPSFLAIGIGRAYNNNSTYKWYWTTDFGSVVDSPVTSIPQQPIIQQPIQQQPIIQQPIQQQPINQQPIQQQPIIQQPVAQQNVSRVTQQQLYEQQLLNQQRQQQVPYQTNIGRTNQTPVGFNLQPQYPSTGIYQLGGTNPYARNVTNYPGYTPTPNYYGISGYQVTNMTNNNKNVGWWIFFILIFLLFIFLIWYLYSHN